MIFSAARKAESALRRIEKEEKDAIPDFLIRGVKIGGSSRIKVLAEIMDAHRCGEIRRLVEDYLASGADIVDLGFGFDATPDDVAGFFPDSGISMHHWPLIRRIHP